MAIYDKTKPFYTFVWCTVDEEDFRSKTPLELMGESRQKFGSTLGIQLIILEGFEKFSKSYLARLSHLGFEIHDYSSRFNDIIDRFPNLNTHYSRYERNCFLRWIVFSEIIYKEDVKDQVWHLDSDLIFYTSLDEITEDTKGKTFVLQGCPAFVSIANKRWFEIYSNELEKLEQDISGYSRVAANEKVILKENDKKLGNASMYRNPLGSDQDMLEYLVGSGKIPQAEYAGTLTSRFCFLENPLSIRRLLPTNGLKNKNKFTDNQNGLLFYEKKPLPFVHYQGTFCFFANIYLCLVQWQLHNVKLWRKLLLFAAIDTKFKISLSAKIIWKIAKWRRMRFSKETVIRLLTSRNGTKSSFPITELLNFINETKDIK